MTYAANVDGNQGEIVRVLRLAGYTVQVLNQVKDGCPDLLVGAYGRNILLEVKNPEQDPCKRVLNDAEAKWHRTWRGQVAVVETPEEAIKMVRAVLERGRSACS